MDSSRFLLRFFFSKIQGQSGRIAIELKECGAQGEIEFGEEKLNHL